ncbi:MAG TPA: hypothetical protein VM943_09890, partial [Pyrinomonadaceae bacterium]|nr:hypothetical protein [Pyrinomonadaceae bacterium]
MKMLRLSGEDASVRANPAREKRAPEKHASIALRAATLRPVSVRLENDGGGASVRIAVTRGAMIRAAPQY